MRPIPEQIPPKVPSPGTAAILKPLYGQVRDLLASRISAGEWAPGAMLPNETTLANNFGVSIGTIRRAVEGLEDLGLVMRRQGRGTYVGGVGSNAVNDRLSRLRAPSGAPLKVENEFLGERRRAATASETMLLNLPSTVEVAEMRSVLIHRHARIGVEASIVPAATLAALPGVAEGAANIYALLGQVGVLVTSAQEVVGAGHADAEIAGQLRTSPGTPLLNVRRVALTIDQKPIELRFGSYVAGHVAYCNRIV